MGLKITKIWLITLAVLVTKVVVSEYASVSSFDLMRCAYGERGSLTATCVNATPGFFKSTLYKFDNLDETLRCLNCTLKTLDSGTFDLSGNQIKILDLRNSGIETMRAKAFMGLIFLENLNLSENKIRSVYPGTFTGVKKIKKVDLSKNSLTILAEDGFLDLIQLEELDLSENAVKVIDKNAFRGLKSLKVLKLHLNFIETIPDTSCQNLTSLQMLDLSYNKLNNLNGTEFAELDNLLEVDLSYNLLPAISPIIFTRPNSLRVLNLSYNNISDIGKQGVFHHLNALEELYLNNNNISALQIKTFESLWNLHILDLSNNFLKEIKTGTFTGLPQLRTLNCSFNMIASVAVTGVFPLPSLHTLDLSHNQISDLDYLALIWRMPRLTYLKLEDNNLPCDLESEMKTYFLESNFKFVLYDDIIGAPKCVNISKLPINARDIILELREAHVDVKSIFIFLILVCLVISVVVLFYLHYKFVYRNSRMGGSTSIQYLTGMGSKEDINC